MKTLGIVANCTKPSATAALRKVQRLARELKLKLVVTTPEESARMPAARLISPSELHQAVDAVLALGGDGTVLHAARLLAFQPRPILGVNLGSLGFLTSVAENDLPHALRALVRGTFTVSRRSALHCRALRGKRELAVRCALNDVVLGWGESSRLITLDLSLNGEPVTSYNCDGLIVSTPTGSTAHSLSAGGPILHPETPCFVITAICPHTLSHRPLVVSEKTAIRITIRRSGKKLLLSVDGQETQDLQEGDVVEIARNSQPVHFVQLPQCNYFVLLRHKMGWRGSNI